MQGVLEAYGFGTKCKNWFKLLNKNLKANILVNGFTMESIEGKHPFTPYSGFTPGTPVFTYYKLLKVK